MDWDLDLDLDLDLDHGPLRILLFSPVFASVSTSFDKPKVVTREAQHSTAEQEDPRKFYILKHFLKFVMYFFDSSS